jgi:hypothetical protein
MVDRELDALARQLLALPVERLVIGVFVDQDHRQQARPGEAPGDRMEGRRRLGDLLAGAAAELLPHMFSDEQLSGTTSSVSVTSSPIFESLVPPQHGQQAGAGCTMRRRGR